MKPRVITRRGSLVLALVAAGLVPTAAGAAPQAPPGSGASVTTVAFDNVIVVDVVDGSLRPAQTVLVEGNRIAAVEPSSDVVLQDDTRIIDGAGGYLIPGLWDMHVHMLQHDGLALDTDAHLPLLVANGVTGVRDMWGDLAEARQLREAIDSGERLGPRLLTPGTIIDGPDVTWPGAAEVATPERARFLVDSLASAGADFIKVYTGLPREVYFAVVERAREVGIPIAGHVPVTVRVAEASGAGQASMEHLSPFLLDCSSRGQHMRGPVRPTPELLRALLDTPDAEGCREMIERLAADGTWQVPTLVAERRWRSLEVPDSIDMEGRWYMPPAHQVAWTRELERQRSMPLEARAVMRDWFAWKVHMVGEMHRAGVPILAGTDVNSDGLPPFLASGFSLHEELELLVEAGLSPADALRTATLNPARFLGATDSLGTVESGKVANLVLLERNPLEDIGNTRHIRAVVLNGRLLTHDDLSTLRERVLLQNARKGSRTPGPERWRGERMLRGGYEEEADTVCLASAQPFAVTGVTFNPRPCDVSARRR